MSNDNGKKVICQHLRGVGQDTWALKLETCGNPVRILKCAQCGWEARPLKFHCKLRLCADCMAERANVFRYKYLDAVKQMKAPAFWTLTLVDSNDLEGDLDRIRKAFNKLRHRKPYAHLLRGGLYALEITEGKTRRYRVHLHALVDSYFVSQKQLSDDWRSLTGDSYIVDVRRVRGKRDKALSYILKYVSKLWRMTDETVEFVADVCKRIERSRLLQPVGTLYGAAKELVKGSSGCPTCNVDLWIVLDFLTHEVLFDTVEILRHRAARGSPA